MAITLSRAGLNSRQWHGLKQPYLTGWGNGGEMFAVAPKLLSGGYFPSGLAAVPGLERWCYDIE